MLKKSKKKKPSHLGVRRHVVPDLRPLPRDRVDQTLREPGLREALHHVQGGHGALRRRLEDHRVSRDQSRRELGDGEVDGVVEGGDAL